MKICYFILSLSLLSLCSCQSIGLFHEPFLQEINKFKTNIENEELKNAVNDFIRTNKITKNHSIKTVDLSNVYANCNLDFEVRLVRSFLLPASDHQIAHINIGGALMSKDEKPKFINYEACTIGVAIKGSEPNTVYSLLYDIKFEFNRTSFNEIYNMNLTYDDEGKVIRYIFYTVAYEIYIYNIFPVKNQKLCIDKVNKIIYNKKNMN